ncbi:hypothetical protein [Micromonospora sp. NPDC051006]|uniref:hypothetical protein n=1 Tax=Micromonospora sp. NPDC051006 TaxID=3364283 RepID=UPI003794A407
MDRATAAPCTGRWPPVAAGGTFEMRQPFTFAIDPADLLHEEAAERDEAPAQVDGEN